MNNKRLARTPMLKDYYAVLGISQNATQEEIRSTYRQLVLRYHPDVSQEPDAEEHFKEINEAYTMLSDPEKRKVYDIFITMITGGMGEFTSNEAPTPPVYTSQRTQQTSPPPSPHPYGPPPSQNVQASPSGASNYGYPPPPQPAPPSPPPGRERTRARRARPFPPTWALLLIMLGIVILASIGVSALMSMQQVQPTGGAESLEVNKLPMFTFPPTLPPDISVIQENGVPVTANTPEALVVGRAKETFAVVGVIPEEGRWPIPTEDSGIAVWVYGTLVNYVLGVPHTPTTESVLAGLTSGERITLTLSNGNHLIFGSPQTQRIAATDTSPMSQMQPGLTLVLLGGTQSDRLVVHARYLPEVNLASGNEQRVGNITATVLDNNVVNADGKNYFIVEYRVTNQSDQPVDPTLFDLGLQDGTGLRYQPNPEATLHGQRGALTTSILPNTPAEGSVGYLVPEDINTPLTWVFRVDPASAEAARFVLAYEPPPLAPPQPSIELTSAFADPARQTVVINGIARNLGRAALEVRLEDVQLSSSAGSITLQSANPPLPWTIEGGMEQNFDLQFNQPADSQTILLDILGFTFEVGAP